MSKDLVSQQLKMTCDACGKTKTWEMVGADNNIHILQEMQEWYTIVHKVVDYREGKLVQLAGDACSLDCIPVLAVKLQIPSEENGGQIDIDALRAGDFNTN